MRWCNLKTATCAEKGFRRSGGNGVKIGSAVAGVEVGAGDYF